MPRLAAIFATPCLLVLAAAPVTRAESPPQVYSWSGPALAAVKARLTQGDSQLQPALAALTKEADRVLSMPPASVMDKTRMPPSGDKHDYLSQAPYWWPDPKNPSGPYIRHDGRRNPERLVGTDLATWDRVADAVEALGLAYYFTGKQAYADHAALLTRVWFLDPATRVNPNINFGQFVPGLNQGRDAGVLEFRKLMPLTDSLTLISSSGAWTAEDQQGMRSWLSEYFEWLTHNPLALKEAAASNNHGTWCDAQISHLALVLSRKELARDRIVAALHRRTTEQIQPDGRQPFELARTKALNYSLLNLEGLFDLARLGDCVGVDAWDPATAEGRSLQAALHYLAPYADPQKPWPMPDIEAGDRTRLFPLFAEYLRHREDPELQALLTRFGPPDGRWRLNLTSGPLSFQ